MILVGWTNYEAARDIKGCCDYCGRFGELSKSPISGLFAFLGDFCLIKQLSIIFEARYMYIYIYMIPNSQCGWKFHGREHVVRERVFGMN